MKRVYVHIYAHSPFSVSTLNITVLPLFAREAPFSSEKNVCPEKAVLEDDYLINSSILITKPHCEIFRMAYAVVINQV